MSIEKKLAELEDRLAKAQSALAVECSQRENAEKLLREGKWSSENGRRILREEAERRLRIKAEAENAKLRTDLASSHALVVELMDHPPLVVGPGRMTHGN